MSLLAVLAGYGLLVVAAGLLASKERRSTHRATVEAVRSLLLSQARPQGGIDGLSDGLAGLVSPNFLGWVETDQGIPYRAARQIQQFSIPTGMSLVRLQQIGSDPHQVASFQLAGQTYLTSSITVQSGGRPLRIRFLEDITAKLAQQRLLLILLVVAAGVATLFTGLLLRPVLDRGLSPLGDLGRRIQTISTDTLDTQRLAIQHQPRELAPIALAFNDLLDRLSSAWEQQRGFVNGVSHELRTPLTLIRNYASALRRRSRDLSRHQVEQVALIEDEATRMGQLVADLLSLTRIEAQRTVMPFDPFDVAEAIERVVDRLQARCDGRLLIRSGATDGVRTFAFGDPKRFEHCLANVIENAVKYVPDASPIVLRLDASLDRIVVHVIDSGPGVPDSEKKRIFERFGRGRNTGSIPGTGVGLAVVRAMMEAMGGSVAVADAPEGGADFQLRLRGAAPLRAT